MNWFHWVKLITGLWVLFSPWILGFSGITTALWSNMIAGALIVIFALWGLFGGKPSAPQMPQ